MKTPQLAVLGGRPVRTRPFPAWPVFAKAEEARLLRTLRSGKWGRLEGPEAAGFEKRFATMHGCKHGIGVVNGTVSLRIALMAAGTAQAGGLALTGETGVARTPLAMSLAPLQFAIAAATGVLVPLLTLGFGLPLGLYWAIHVPFIDVGFDNLFDESDWLVLGAFGGYGDDGAGDVADVERHAGARRGPARRGPAPRPAAAAAATRRRPARPPPRPAGAPQRSAAR